MQTIFYPAGKQKNVLVKGEEVSKDAKKIKSEKGLLEHIRPFAEKNLLQIFYPCHTLIQSLFRMRYPVYFYLFMNRVG